MTRSISARGLQRLADIIVDERGRPSLLLPGCLAYGGEGWSRGVLHTLEGSRVAVHCQPLPPDVTRTRETLELDHVLAAVFGLWDFVIPEARAFARTAVGPGLHATRKPVAEKKLAE